MSANSQQPWPGALPPIATTHHQGLMPKFVAPLTSSGGANPTLSVAAATTGAAGSLSAADKTKLDILLNPPRFRAYNSVAQSIPNAAMTVLTFDNARWNTQGAVGGAAFAVNRWTVATGGAGMYEFGLHLRWGVSADGSRRVAQIRVNGNTAFAVDDRAGGFSSSVAESHNLVTRIQLADGDYVEAQAYQNTGAALNTWQEVADSVEFWGAWKHP